MIRRRWPILIISGIVVCGTVLAAYWYVFRPYRNLDVLILNGTLIDGSGAPPVVTDIGIRDGKIIALSNWKFYFSKPTLTIDANGSVVAPGFIDVHTHVEPNIPSSDPFRAENFLRQGVTTIITGNCGRSRTDIASLFRGLEKNGSYVNVATFVGHNSIRQQVMENASRPPTATELKTMRAIVGLAMKEGALGISTGLEYVPGRFAELSEVVELAKIAAKDDGIYASHIRDEGPKGIAALREALEVGRQAKIATQISHFKASGPRQWRTVLTRLDVLDEARAEGQTVTIDIYPYASSSTTTDILLPDWAVKDNRAALRQIVTSPQLRQKLHADILSKLIEDGWSDLSFVRLAAGRPEWIGKTLAEVPSFAQDVNQQIENLIEVSLRGGAQAVYASMSEDDVEQVVTYPFCVFGSDSAVRDPSAQYHPHPRGCGTFPRIFAQYVREKKLLTLEDAVHKATGEAAELFQLPKRGLLQPGHWADIAIFDSQTIADTATYEKPFGEPVGIDYVIVNGVVAVDHGALTSEKPAGMPIRKAGRTA
ncbi:MAG: N-acyl-D-amino-acid deacylase family protein [Acidobacteriota bacterium]